MAIKNIQTVQTGLVGVLPSLAYIYTSDTEAEILTAGYLNHEVQQGAQFSMPCIAAVSTQATPTSAPQVGWYQIAHVGTNWSLVTPGNSGDIVLPTTANHIATYTNATGTLSEDAAIAINAGDIQAGGTGGIGGGFISYPPNPAHGHLVFESTASLGPAVVTVTNADHNQTSTYSIPDSGAVTANFLLDEGVNDKGTFTTISTGATPVPMVDPALTEINVVAGAANTALIEVQLKDGTGADINLRTPFTIYASSASNGLTLASAASTGFAFIGTGLGLQNGTAVTTQIHGITSTGGQAVMSLVDTAKQTSYLVVVVGDGIAISAQLTAGSYG